ncbi:MAG TPA: hypothetical protein VK700_03960 [Steroidobacteraceae bacterium]|jgi:hypothetical protein|nr:hypothetical protein [Steroidobacteraceae bacterium]
MNIFSTGAKSVGLLITLAAFSALPAPQASAADDCCSIVSIDTAHGTLTLRDDQTGTVVTVAVKDPKQLAKLVVGQRTDHAGVRYCSISSFEPCLDQVRSHNCQPCPDEH